MPKRPVTQKADPVRRASRTLFQAGTVQALIQLWNAFSPTDITIEQAAILTTLGTPLVSFIQNLLEEQQVVPTMLKGPTPHADPTPDETVQAELVALAREIAQLKAEMRAQPVAPPDVSNASVESRR